MRGARGQRIASRPGGQARGLEAVVRNAGQKRDSAWALGRAKLADIVGIELHVMVQRGDDV